MTLSKAQSLATAIEHATQQFESHIHPILQDYINFLPERGIGWEPERYGMASDYTFARTESESFIFESDEFYQSGEYTQDTIALPFEFVEHPKAFKARIRAEIVAAKEKHASDRRLHAQNRIAALEAQLAKARKDLGD